MTAAEIFALMGRPVVLLKVERKTKRPLAKEWQKTTLEDMTEQYLAGLNGDTNIGILHGAASGSLAGIEWDTQAAAEAFFNANPNLNTLCSKAVRGACFWVFIAGQYPKAGKFKVDGKDVGEWRVDGMQTIFSGVHPDGVNYKNNGKRPATVRFENIVWPDGITLPWEQKPAPAAAIPQEENDIHAFLVAKCGRPFSVNRDGSISRFNPNYFSQRFCLETLILFEFEEGWFFVYSEETGAWHKTPAASVKKMFKEYFERLAKDVFGHVAAQLFPKCTNTFENSLVDNIKSVCGRMKIFKPLQRIIHCKNGMLHLDADRAWRLLPFAPDYYSRNPIGINWREDATAPLFSGILANLPAYDSSLFLRYAGNILLTGNVAQSILILVGAGGTSKSTLCEIIELVMGTDNYIELRTNVLHERFEIGRYLGKTLLTGKDVPGDFLMTEGASSLKKLTGHDNQTGEIKNQMGTPLIRGEFAVLITCNERLLIRIEGDVSAWRRRLLILELPATAKHKEVIGNYAKLVFNGEAEGILAMMVDGAFDHLEECAVRAEFKLVPQQIARVEGLLAESQSIEMFLKARVVKRAGDSITTEQLTTGYGEYCEERGWETIELKKLQRELPNKMFQLFGTHLVNGVEDPSGKRVRGYRGVAIDDGQNDDPRQYADVPPECAEGMFS